MEDHSPQLAAWIRAGEHLTLAGRRVFCRVQAHPGREPLLLIHGYPTSSYDWHGAWDALAARHSLYALDLLGFGLSAKPRDSDYPIALQADLCEALLAHFRIERPHVLAHDYGDTVAQELLAREAEGRLQLASVCFLNGGLFPETHRALPIQRVLARPLLGPFVASHMTYRMFRRGMRSVAGRVPPADAELRDLWALQVRDDGRHALGRLIGYMAQREWNRARWVGALVNTTVPCRLLCGARDPVSGAHLAQRYREVVPGADVIEFADLGHYPQLEAPALVAAAHGEFIAALGARLSPA